MTWLEALQVLAFRDVLCKTPAYRIRAMQRWYSQTFATPLHVVERDLPLQNVLQHYFEYQFETAESEELQELKQKILETEDQRRARVRTEEADAVANEEIHRALEAEARKVAEQRQKNPAAQFVPVQPTNPMVPVPETHLPDTLPKDMPPEIEMKFVSPEELERRMEEFGQVPIPVRKQS